MHLGNLNGFAIEGLSILAIISLLIGLLVSVLWLVIGWRAMRAHEKIADRVAKLSLPQQQTQLPGATVPPSNAAPTPIPPANQQENFRQLNVENNKLYRHFLSDCPEAASSLPKIRHELFREWKIKNGFES